jgi:hypothetical protein
VQTRLIREYLQRSVTEYKQPSSQPSLEQCVAIPSTLTDGHTTAAYSHELERVQQEIREQQQQQYCNLIMANMLSWKYGTVYLPDETQCIAAARQYWPLLYVQWHDDFDRTKLEVQLMCARLWWPNDVMLQTVLIQQYLRDNIVTRYHWRSTRSSSDPLCVAIP